MSVLAGFSLPTTLIAQSSPRQPNVVIIVADDLGYGDLSCYGAHRIQTPGMDRIANEGIRFRQGYCTAATSTPSRYSLLTGLYPWTNREAKILPGNSALIIHTQQVTLPKVIKQAGYVTGSVGKWHLGLGDGAVDWNKLVYPGAKEIGYDYSFIQAATNDRVPCIFIENGRGVNLDPNDPLYVSYKENFPGEPTGKVNRLHQPHVPRVPNERFAGKSGMGPRGDVILEADWCVTEFLKEMDKLGLTENTLVIFTSDNGPVLDDGYQDQAVELVGDHKMAGPLRGGKTSLYDGGTCIPFMLRWPAEVKPGAVSDALVCQMDLLASLSALIGQTYSDKVDSQNTLPVFLGKGGNGRKELVLEGYFNYALRDGDWVMIPPYPDTYGDAEEAAFAGNSNCYQLYNVKEDIGQQVNLAEKEPKRLRQMMMTFERLKRETGKITNF